MIKTKISQGFAKVICADFEPRTEYKLYMAKNEGESSVISIVSDKNEAVTLENLTPHADFKVEFELEYTIPVKGVDYPDPLVPTDGKLTLEENKITNVLVRFITTESTPAGEHEFVLSLKNSDGEEIVKYTLTVKVWDFALKDEERIVSTMGLVRGGISHAHKLRDLPDEERHAREQDLYVKYYDMLLAFGVSAYDLPYDILDPRADEYMSNPRVGAFRVNNYCSDDRIKSYYEKILKNPEWLEKSFFYPIDEPRVREHMDDVKRASDKFHTLCPGVKIISPFFKNQYYDEDYDQVEILVNYLDIICPKITCWNDEVIYADDKSRLDQFGTFESRMDKARDAGRTIWQYVCWEPGKPYVNLYINEGGLDHRVLFWQQHQVGAKGFLYWCANWWEYVADPWLDMATVRDLSDDVFGDGSVLYNGNKVGIDGPCASVRLEAVRDGLEDAQMLAMAEKLLGKEWTDAHVKSVTADLTHYTEDAEYFMEKRRELGDAIEAAMRR